MERRMLQGQYAGFLSRAVALIIDLLLIIISVLAVSWFITMLLQQFLGLNVSACPTVTETRGAFRVFLCEGARIFLFAFGILSGPVYFIVLWTLTGQTIGKYYHGYTDRPFGRPSCEPVDSNYSLYRLFRLTDTIWPGFLQSVDQRPPAGLARYDGWDLCDLCLGSAPE